MTIIFPQKTSDFLKIGVAAAARGDVPTVQKILKARPKWITRVGSHGRTMLWEACHRGKLEMVKYLVRRGADIDACGTHYTPYFVEISCYCVARHKRRTEVADFLLAKGAHTDIHTSAFLAENDAVARYLADDPTLVNSGHPHYAMGDLIKGEGFEFHLLSEELVYLCRGDRGGNPEAVRGLLGLGADVNHHDAKGKTALHRASRAGFVETMRILLDNGADLEAMDTNGETPLFDAIRSTIRNAEKKQTAILALLEAGANADHRNHKNRSPRDLVPVAVLRQTK